jgi:ech hydrogenase subunit A
VELILFLILFPLIPALLLSVLPGGILRASVVKLGAVAIAAVSVYLAVKYLGKPGFFAFELPHLETGFFIAEMALAVFLLVKCSKIKASEVYVPILIAAQAGIMAFIELTHSVPKVEHPLYVDNFSIIMALIIGIIGSLICVYAINYMKDYHHHHHDMKDGQRGFFFILFFFLSAMFGIVFCNNLVWLYFFWEVTTLSSFMLIGYPKTEEATRNAYRALGLNSLGGLAFSLALLYTTKFVPEPTVDLNVLLTSGAKWVLIPAALIGLAGLTKSAQMPFSSWLLGAMVAPTPVSALLHSSTMVKAGVFILVKFACVYQHTKIGYMLALVGGVTFMMTSILAVTQSNAKRVLAYSTIANLGLIVACAGVGTHATVWAAIMLIIFHAVSKGLLFLGVGTIEHQIGSRDIEDMDGLITTRPGLALCMLIGILGMFLAPFGMLISKWATLEAFVGSSQILAVLVAYGSAPTLFFWTKWMGKLVSVKENTVKSTDKVNGDEWMVLLILAIGTIVSAATFPLIGHFSIEPYIAAVFNQTVSLGQGNIIIMLIMLALILLLPLSFLLVPRKAKLSTVYLAGANISGSSTFQGSVGIQNVSMKNYYLANFFNEKKLTVLSIVITIALIAGMFSMVKL